MGSDAHRIDVGLGHGLLMARDDEPPQFGVSAQFNTNPNSMQIAHGVWSGTPFQSSVLAGGCSFPNTRLKGGKEWGYPHPPVERRLLLLPH